MKGFYLVMAFVFLSQISFGQIGSLKSSSPIDSTKSRMESFKTTIESKADSLSNPIKNAIKRNVISDTLASINSRLDSIQNNLNSRVDSLTQSYTKALMKIQSAAERYQSKIDSLRSLKLSANKYKAKMDSLSQQFAKVQQDLTAKIEDIKKNATEKIRSIKLPPELEDKVSKLTDSIGSLNIKSIEAKLPTNLDLDKLTALKNSFSINGLGGATQLDAPGIPKIDVLDKNVSIPEIKPGVNDIKGLNEVSNINGQAEAVQGKISDAAKDLNPNSIDKLAESKVSELKEVKALKETSSELPLGAAKSEEELKAELKKQAQKIAVDHFAGKEQQLKAAMEKISKYKQKYSSVKSIADISKKPRNEMKEKPLIERIVPGIGIQFQKKGDDLLLDFNPYIGYRFTTRITAGPGWNQRIAYNFDINAFNSNVRIFGPRIFGEFKLGKGFLPRVELEVMNTNVPPLTQTPTLDPEFREWVWGAFAGMKKEYKLFKKVKGTASVMMRLFDPNHKSPYADVVNARFGFEFPTRKKHSRE